MMTREQYMLMGPAGVIRECERLEGELAAVRLALDDCDLTPAGTLADRIHALTHHHREWKRIFADMANRRAAETDYAGSLQRAASALRKASGELIYGVAKALDISHFACRAERDAVLTALHEIDAVLAKNPVNAEPSASTQSAGTMESALNPGHHQRTTGAVDHPDNASHSLREREEAGNVSGSTNAVLVEDVRTILRGFDEEVFIRDVAHDAESAWAMKLIPYMQALGRLAANVNPETMPPGAQARTEIGQCRDCKGTGYIDGTRQLRCLTCGVLAVGNLDWGAMKEAHRLWWKDATHEQRYDSLTIFEAGAKWAQTIPSQGTPREPTT